MSVYQTEMAREGLLGADDMRLSGRAAGHRRRTRPYHVLLTEF